MKHELDRMMDLIKDYKTGYGGVTDSFIRKELEMFAKDYHSEQCNIADVVGQSEQLVCPHQATRTPNEEKTGKCRQCGRKIKAN